MNKPAIEFWYEFASTYSYPASMRIADLAQVAGVAVQWRPFLLGPVFKAQGWHTSPFVIYPAKGRYMFRDVERICESQDLKFKLPPLEPPQNGLKAARLALVGERAGWIADFSRRVYIANFAEQKDISSDVILTEILRNIGVEPATAFAASNLPENKEGLRKNTEEAIARGIFGAPSFTVGDELFWGNDRLEQAIAWAKK